MLKVSKAMHKVNVKKVKKFTRDMAQLCFFSYGILHFKNKSKNMLLNNIIKLFVIKYKIVVS